MALEGAPLRRRRLATSLVKLRENADITQVEATRMLGMSQSELSKIESSTRRAKPRDVEAMCNLYGAEPDITFGLVELARNQDQRGWWHMHSPKAVGTLEDFLWLENDASQVLIWGADVVPGLLQTAEYAYATMRAGLYYISDEAVQERAELRISRQKEFEQRQAELWVVLDETAFLRPLGGVDVMAGQLEHLAEMAKNPRIQIQVLPLSAQENPALGTPFQLLTLGKQQFGYHEHLGGGSFVEDPDIVALYGAAWARLGAASQDFGTSIETIRGAAVSMKGRE